MISKLRAFSKTKLATLLVAIIIIPFVFWGMGGVFRGGNTNSLVKINNENVSTQDLINYINSSRLTSEIIKENIDNNIIEDLLQNLVSETLLEMEIKDLNISISDKTIFDVITSDKEFLDDNNKFSRIKYEKFLLKNNLSATEFEYRLKKNELNKKLFVYISGGIKSPSFMVNNKYNDENKKIEIEYINLSNIYKKDFTNNDVKKYINENEEKLKIDLIDFKYSVINPTNLIDSDEFNDEFFTKIDEIENYVLNNATIDEINNIYNLEIKKEKNYTVEDNQNPDEIHQIIYNKRNENKIQLIDKNDYYILYEISNLKKILPDVKNINFANKIKKIMYEDNKNQYNKKLILQIENKEFTNNDFNKLKSDNNPSKNTKLTSIKNSEFFTEDSVKLLYSLPKKSFLFMLDKNNNVNLVKILEIYKVNLASNNDLIKKNSIKTNSDQKNELYNSYDNLLNDKYKIVVNQKTLDRFKNHFR